MYRQLLNSTAIDELREEVVAIIWGWVGDKYPFFFRGRSTGRAYRRWLGHASRLGARQAAVYPDPEHYRPDPLSAAAVLPRPAGGPAEFPCGGRGRGGEPAGAVWLNLRGAQGVPESPPLRLAEGRVELRRAG